ncbi:hypothetical protein BDV95DRAFT_210427 [Massariosphaeria phaeospora]|uniref:Uncharacterized protein n=1 Tax=Massariosphaeria phaeospora TaxID=100035 RepID=A0A7C8HZM9_9PLEO|nr:hypothetical protein BDV95DRAFT_210427 [Massariosphaeria phaeospora]
MDVVPPTPDPPTSSPPSSISRPKQPQEPSSASAAVAPLSPPPTRRPSLITTSKLPHDGIEPQPPSDRKPKRTVRFEGFEFPGSETTLGDGDEDLESKGSSLERKEDRNEAQVTDTQPIHATDSVVGPAIPTSSPLSSAPSRLISPGGSSRPTYNFPTLGDNDLPLRTHRAFYNGVLIALETLVEDHAATPAVPLVDLIGELEANQPVFGSEVKIRVKNRGKSKKKKSQKKNQKKNQEKDREENWEKRAVRDGCVWACQAARQVCEENEDHVDVDLVVLESKMKEFVQKELGLYGQ